MKHDARIDWRTLLRSLKKTVTLSPLRNKIAASLLIVGGIFLVCMGYLECVEANLYGIPNSLVRVIIERLLSRGNEDATFVKIMRIALEIYTKTWLLTLAAGVVSMVAGILVVTARVSQGKKLAHYSEMGLPPLIYALALQYLEPELEELLSLVPGAGQVDLRIITPPYFIAWAVFLSFEVANWIAKEPSQTA